MSNPAEAKRRLIQSDWDAFNRDDLGMMQQLGLLPSLS